MQGRFEARSGPLAMRRLIKGTLIAILGFNAGSAFAFDSSDLDSYIEDNAGRGTRSGYESVGPSPEEESRAAFKRELNERLERDGAKNCESMNAYGGASAEMDCRRMYRWD